MSSVMGPAANVCGLLFRPTRVKKSYPGPGCRGYRLRRDWVLTRGVKEGYTTGCRAGVDPRQGGPLPNPFGVLLVGSLTAVTLVSVPDGASPVVKRPRTRRRGGRRARKGRRGHGSVRMRNVRPSRNGGEESLKSRVVRLRSPS